MYGSVPTFPGHEHVPVQPWIRQEGFVCPSPAALAAGADLPVDERGAPTARTGTGQTTETISRLVSFGWSLGKLWEDIKGRGSTKANSSSSCSSSSTGLVVASSRYQLLEAQQWGVLGVLRSEPARCWGEQEDAVVTGGW